MSKIIQDNQDLCNCPICGYQWVRGGNGHHHCSDSLVRKIALLKDRLDLFIDNTVYEIKGEDGKKNYGVIVIGEKDETWGEEMLELIEKEFGQIIKASYYELRFVRRGENGPQLVKSLTEVL